MRRTRTAGVLAAFIAFPLVLALTAESPKPTTVSVAASRPNPAIMLLAPRAVERAVPIDRASRGVARPKIDHGRLVADRRVEHRKEVARARALAERRAAAAAAARRRQQQRVSSAATRTVSVGGGAGYTGMAVAIARCESGGNPRAKNPASTASGLYQFLDTTWEGASGLPAPASAYSVATQTAVFWKVWNGGAGAHNWDPSRSCWG